MKKIKYLILFVLPFIFSCSKAPKVKEEYLKTQKSEYKFKVQLYDGNNRRIFIEKISEDKFMVNMNSEILYLKDNKGNHKYNLENKMYKITLDKSNNRILGEILTKSSGAKIGVYDMYLDYDMIIFDPYEVEIAEYSDDIIVVRYNINSKIFSETLYIDKYDKDSFQSKDRTIRLRKLDEKNYKFILRR